MTFCGKPEKLSVIGKIDVGRKLPQPKQRLDLLDSLFSGRFEFLVFQASDGGPEIFASLEPP